MEREIIFINTGGNYDHKNHAMKFAKKFGKSGLSDMRNKSEHENYASMRDIIGFDYENNFAALYTYQGCPIAIDANKNIKNSIFIGSNKHNACPLVIGRYQGKIIMWHIYYTDMIRMIEEKKKSMRELFPKFLLEVEKQMPQYSMMSVFDNEEAEFLVTSKQLMDKDVLGVKGSINYLELPDDLTIRSIGVEGQIRSYSVAFFFHGDTDILILTGEKNGEDCCWSMGNIFQDDQKWNYVGKISELR